MPKITDAQTLRLAEELIRFGVSADRNSESGRALRDLADGETTEPLSLKKAAAWLKARGHGISYKTIRRQLGTTEEIRAGRVFADPGALRGGGGPVAAPPGLPDAPSAPDAPSPRLGAGFLHLEVDGGSPQPMPADLARAPRSQEPERLRPASRTPPPQEPQPSRATPIPGPDEDEWWLPGNSLRHLIPDDDPTDRDGEVIFTRDELGRLCSAIFTSSVDLSQAAFCEGINPYKAARVVRRGLRDLSKESDTGERTVAMAVFGHWAGRVKRNGQAMAVASARGDVRAMKLLAERLDAQSPELDEAKGGTMATLQAFARQVRAYALTRDEERDSEHRVQVNSG